MCTKLATEITQELEPGEVLTLTRESEGRLVLWKGATVLRVFEQPPNLTYDRRADDVFAALNDVKFLCGHPSRQRKMGVEIERHAEDGPIGEVLIEARVFDMPDEDTPDEDIESESASRPCPVFAITD